MKSKRWYNFQIVWAWAWLVWSVGWLIFTLINLATAGVAHHGVFAILWAVLVGVWVWLLRNAYRQKWWHYGSE